MKIEISKLKEKSEHQKLIKQFLIIWTLFFHSNLDSFLN